MKGRIRSICMVTSFGYLHKGTEYTTPRPSYLQTQSFATQLQLVRTAGYNTLIVEGYGYALLRFITDNPGAWAFHCHITWHMEAGLLMTFLTGGDKIQSMLAQAPSSWANLC